MLRERSRGERYRRRMGRQAASTGPGGKATQTAAAPDGGGSEADEVAATSSPVRRWVVVTLSILLVVALAGTAALVVRSRQTERFCTLEGLIDPTGRHTYHHDPNRDCRWVDENGVPMEDR